MLLEHNLSQFFKFNFSFPNESAIKWWTVLCYKSRDHKCGRERLQRPIPRLGSQLEAYIPRNMSFESAFEKIVCFIPRDAALLRGNQKLSLRGYVYSWENFEFVFEQKCRQRQEWTVCSCEMVRIQRVGSSRELLAHLQLREHGHQLVSGRLTVWFQTCDDTRHWKRTASDSRTYFRN